MDAGTMRDATHFICGAVMGMLVLWVSSLVPYTPEKCPGDPISMVVDMKGRVLCQYLPAARGRVIVRTKGK